MNFDAAAIALATFTYLSIGIFLGLLIPTARAAQGVGMALFFPSFLLGGGGPPPEAMPSVMRSISDVLPMTQAVRAIQHPWLGIGSGNSPRLVILAALLPRHHRRVDPPRQPARELTVPPAVRYSEGL